MKKYSFKAYMLIWTILFVTFNLVVFLVPGIPVVNKYTGTFLIGYFFAALSFILEIPCAWYAFRASSLQKMFYRLPLVNISYGITVIMTILGSVFMILNFLPKWVAGLSCVIVLLLNFIAVIKAGTAAEIVTELDERVKMQTQYIKSLMVDAESLVTRAKPDEIKAECKKVFEAVRYSDPMSNPALNEVESQIAEKFSEFASIAKTEDTEKTKLIAEELLLLIRNRNQKCRLLK